MRISIACDHGGFLLKEELLKWLKGLEYEVINNGCDSLNSVDYPDYAKKTIDDILLKKADLGILVCTTGIGMSIYANRYPNIRAALVTNLDASYMTRSHNDSNIICLAAKYTSFDEAKEYVLKFIETPFSKEEKHQRRIDKIEGVKLCQK